MTAPLRLHRRRPELALGALLATLAASCSPESATPGVQGPTESEEPALPLGATSAQRFGGMPAGAPAAAAPPAAAAQPSYHYTLPQGWSEAGERPMRDVNLVGPGGIECWLTRLGPGAGGLQANVDRWRSQVGLGPASSQELASLPRRNFMGNEALLLDLTSPEGSLRVVGLMQFLSDRSMFLRISGPAEGVTANLAAFDQFASSLHDGAGHSHDPAPGEAAPAAGSAPKDAAGEAEAAQPSDATTNRVDGGGLRWHLPEGWKPLEADAFRLAYYQVDSGTQCWITTLAGNGGGVEANVTRWAGQFGRPTPSPADIGALPKIEVLGREALWVDLLGEDSKDGMIGVLCELPDRAVFLKIQGPSDQVRSHEADFRAFCTSLEPQ